MNRNPDITLGDAIPAGCYLHEGKALMMTARAAGIPFGLCQTKFKYNSRSSKMITHGIIIRECDRVRFNEALARKKSKK